MGVIFPVTSIRRRIEEDEDGAHAPHLPKDFTKTADISRVEECAHEHNLPSDFTKTARRCACPALDAGGCRRGGARYPITIGVKRIIITAMRTRSLNCY